MCVCVCGPHSLADVHEVARGLVLSLHQHQLQLVHQLGVLRDGCRLAARGGGKGCGQRQRTLTAHNDIQMRASEDGREH